MTGNVTTERVPKSPSSPATSSTPARDSSEDKKAEWRSKGRESLRKRLYEAGHDPTLIPSDTDADDLENDADVDASTLANGVPHRRKKKDVGDLEYRPEDEINSEEEAMMEDVEVKKKTPMRRRLKKKAGVEAGDEKADETEEHLREREIGSASPMKSKFVEGSMNDRASVPPPPEMIGSKSSCEPEEQARPSADDTRKSEGAGENRKRGLAGFNFGKLNPFAIASEIRSAWQRQKEAYEARERYKAEKVRRKAERERAEVAGHQSREYYEQEYKRLKASGAFAPTKQPVIGQALTTDEPQAWPSSGRKRKRGEVVPIADSDAPVFSHNDNEDGMSSSEEFESENEAQNYQRLQLQQLFSPPPSVPPMPAPIPPATVVKKSSTVSISSVTSASGRQLTKQELRKRERLRKKRSTLEEQLQKIKTELKDLESGDEEMVQQPPVPPIPIHLMPLTPGTPGQAQDEDVVMHDEEFSMIPLAPVLNSTGELAGLKDTETPGKKLRKTGASGRMPGRKKGPERKKRKGLESPPPKVNGAGREMPPPPVPSMPLKLAK